MRWILVTAVFLALIVSPAFAQTWWNTSVPNKMQFNITNNAGSSLTDFVVVVNQSSDIASGFNTQALISGGKMQSDCDDIWILDSSETVLKPHYIENNTCNTTNTVINFVTSLASGSNTFYIYFGNSTASNHENRSAIVRARNATAWYDFSESTGSSSAEYTGYGNPGNLTLTNSPSHNYTARGYGLGLEGGTDYASSQYQMLYYQGNVYYIELWVYNDQIISMSGQAEIFSDQQSQGHAFFRDTNPGNGYRYLSYSTILGDWNNYPPINITTGTWHHLVLAKNNSNFTYYMDGVSVLSNISANYDEGTLQTGARALSFGDFLPTAPSARQWNGTVDNFRLVVGQTITPAEVKAKYDGLLSTFGTTQLLTDTVKPQIIFTNPVNDTQNLTSTGSLTPVLFNITVSDFGGLVTSNIDSCNMNIDGTNYTMTKVGTGNNVTCVLSFNFSLGPHSYRAFANDTAGNMQSSYFANMSSYLSSTGSSGVPVYPSYEPAGSSATYVYKPFKNGTLVRFDYGMAGSTCCTNISARFDRGTVYERNVTDVLVGSDSFLKVSWEGYNIPVYSTDGVGGPLSASYRSFLSKISGTSISWKSSGRPPFLWRAWYNPDNGTRQFNMLDATPPDITDIFSVPASPVNVPFNATPVNVTFNATVTDFGGVDTVLLLLSGHNHTMSGVGSNYSFTEQVPCGNTQYSIWANDTSGNFRQTNSSFFDIGCGMTFPDISIVRPIDGGFYNVTNISFVFNAFNNESIDSCWYDINDMTPVYMPECFNQSVVNISTSFIVSEGFVDLDLYVNDSFGILNFSDSEFTIDLTAPFITIINPNGVVASDTDIPLTYNITDLSSGVNASSCYYILDGGSPVTLPGCTASTINVITGSHNIAVYGSDTAGNQGSGYVSFRAGVVYTGAMASILIFMPLLIGVGIITLVARRLEDLQNTEDFVVMVVGTGIAIVMLGIFAAIIGGLV